MGDITHDCILKNHHTVTISDSIIPLIALDCANDNNNKKLVSLEVRSVLNS